MWHLNHDFHQPHWDSNHSTIQSYQSPHLYIGQSRSILLQFVMKWLCIKKKVFRTFIARNVLEWEYGKSRKPMVRTIEESECGLGSILQLLFALALLYIWMEGMEARALDEGKRMEIARHLSCMQMTRFSTANRKRIWRRWWDGLLRCVKEGV